MYGPTFAAKTDLGGRPTFAAGDGVWCELFGEECCAWPCVGGVRGDIRTEMKERKDLPGFWEDKVSVQRESAVRQTGRSAVSHTQTSSPRVPLEGAGADGRPF